MVIDFSVVYCVSADGKKFIYVEFIELQKSKSIGTEIVVAARETVDLL